MVAVAQLVELSVVVRAVAGSIPVSHPVKNKDLFLRFLFFTFVLKLVRGRKPEARVPEHERVLRRGSDHLGFEELCSEQSLVSCDRSLSATHKNKDPLRVFVYFQ